jgi:hypothetical protein
VAGSSPLFLEANAEFSARLLTASHFQFGPGEIGPSGDFDAMLTALRAFDALANAT